MRIEVMRGHTKSLDANDKLIQTRYHVRNAIASRERQVVMRKVKSTIPSRGPPVRHFLQMSTKPVTTTATTATRAGCVRHGLGPKTQHTPAEHRGQTADKISVIKQLAYKNKAFISFFKENVRYPVWTCRDPISLNLGTRFSLILGTRC